MWRQTKLHKELYHLIFSHYLASPSKGESSIIVISNIFISISWLIPKLRFDLGKSLFPTYFPFFLCVGNRYRATTFRIDIICRDESIPLRCVKSLEDHGNHHHNPDILGALLRIRFESTYISQIQVHNSIPHLQFIVFMILPSFQTLYLNSSIQFTKEDPQINQSNQY